MHVQSSPYRCHVFVCVNDRKGESKACADGLGTQLKDRLKAEVEARGWKPCVRVSSSGCLGLCMRGPNVMLYPQGRWFSGVALEDCEAILEAVRRTVFPESGDAASAARPTPCSAG